MSRARRRLALHPAIEALEQKALLSTIPLAPPMAGRVEVMRHRRHHHHHKPPPPPTPSALAVTVTTDRQSYAVGESVPITITEKNTGSRDVGVTFGCRILQGFVTRNGVEVWRFVDLRACPTGLTVLHARQSRQLTLVWDGSFNRPGLPASVPKTGTFVVHAGVDGVVATSTVQIK